jgi:hypothetical protein
MSFMKTVKAALQDRCEEIVRELVPGGHRSGRVYSAKNPARADRSAGSFVVWLGGPAAGAWKDYATGEQGDIIDLVCLVKGCDRKAALEWSADRVGAKSMSSETRREIERRARQRAANRVERERHEEEAALARARRMFASAVPDAFRQPIVVNYLARRGIDYRALKNVEDDFRFLPAMEWWPGRDRETGAPGRKFPALVSAMVNVAGNLVAVHLTFLAADGGGKAPVDKAKLMWPRTRGAVIRVSRGFRNLNAETAAGKGERQMLALTEGIEDALTISLAAPEMRVWAAGSLPGLMAVPDHDCASGFLVVKDNDWGKPQAAALFDKAVARLRSFGKPVEVIAPPGQAKDVNDYLNGEAA